MGGLARLQMPCPSRGPLGHSPSELGLGDNPSHLLLFPGPEGTRLPTFCRDPQPCLESVSLELESSDPGWSEGSQDVTAWCQEGLEAAPGQLANSATQTAQGPRVLT